MVSIVIGVYLSRIGIGLGTQTIAHFVVISIFKGDSVCAADMVGQFCEPVAQIVLVINTGTIAQGELRSAGKLIVAVFGQDIIIVRDYLLNTAQRVIAVDKTECLGLLTTLVRLWFLGLFGLFAFLGFLVLLRLLSLFRPWLGLGGLLLGGAFALFVFCGQRARPAVLGPLGLFRSWRFSGQDGNTRVGHFRAQPTCVVFVGDGPAVGIGDAGRTPQPIIRVLDCVSPVIDICETPCDVIGKLNIGIMWPVLDCHAPQGIVLILNRLTCTIDAAGHLVVSVVVHFLIGAAFIGGANQRVKSVVRVMGDIASCILNLCHIAILIIGVFSHTTIGIQGLPHEAACVINDLCAVAFGICHAVGVFIFCVRVFRDIA